MTDTEVDGALSVALDAEESKQSGRLFAAVRGAPPWATAAAGIVVIVVVWWFLSLLSSPTGSGAVPSPVNVFVQLVQDLGDPIYWNAITQTGGAAALGYVWGNGIALLLAFLVLLVPWTEGISTQLAVVASCIPLTAIGPIVALMSPASSRVTSIFLAAISVIFTTVIGALLGLRAASATQLDVIRAYGGSRFTQLRKVRLIAAVPALMAALKIAAPAAFLGAVLGEYFLIGVDSGLGIQLLAAQADNASVRLWAIALICGGVAGLAYFLIGLAGRAIAPWSSGDASAKAVF